MKMDTLNKWLTLAANIGVIAGIVFLGYELQQNRAATQANSRDAIINSELVVLQMMLENPSLARLSYSGEVTENQSIQLEYILIATVRTREHQWRQYRNGLLDKQTMDSFLSALSSTMSAPRTRAWWDLFAYDIFDDDFVDETNKILEKIPVRQNYRPTFSGDDAVIKI